MNSLDQPGSLDTPLPSKACQVCAKLRSTFTDHISSRIQAEGTLDTILGTECVGHKHLFDFLRADIRKKLSRDLKPVDDDTASSDCADNVHGGTDKNSSRQEEVGEDDEQDEGSLSGRNPMHGFRVLCLAFYPGHPRASLGAGGTTTRISITTTSFTSFWTLKMAKFSHEPQTPGFGRVLDPNWVDVDLARRWKRNCFAQHKEKCHNPLRIKTASPAWVIDTAQRCIVSGAGVTEYVALSYRWGVSAGFRTTSDILNVLQEPGALSPGSRLGASTAPILHHAMGLTQAIDERYLWVDAVCIVQDDESHLTTQLNLMGAIYATAKLTIVASDGDSMEGILGLRGLSPRRHVKQDIIPIFERDKLITRYPPTLSSSSSPYFDRGWTFQEYHLSQRRLTFADGQIHWHCSCADWEEDLIPQSYARVGRPYVEDNALDILKRQPDFIALNELVSNYNGRRLSFPEDALPAISGLLSILSRSFEGGFLFGLPEIAFDSALMWGSFWGQSLIRREDSGNKSPLAMTSRLPSWSWVSWEGSGLRVLDEETFKGPDRNSWTTPITEWFTHDSPDAIEKRPIHSNWFSFRERFKDITCKLPEGWTREEYDGIKHAGPQPEGLGHCVYRHAAMPDEHFWLPVPITSVDQESDLLGPAQTPYISCRTRRGWFAGVQFPPAKFLDRLRATKHHLFNAGLLNESGDYCGRLFLQDTADIVGFPEASSGQTCQIELVAICRRREEETWVNSWKPEDEEWPIPGTVFIDVYGVLWVEWINGIAYRRASGIVDKDAWESHVLEDVQLVLG